MAIAYQTVAQLSELPEGGNLFVEVDDQPVALFRVEGQVFAIDDVCTHDGGPLADGKLIGHEIECDRHGARFDIRTGSVLCMPAVECVRAHHVKVEGESIMVAINDSGDLPKEAPKAPLAAASSSTAPVTSSAAATETAIPAAELNFDQETIVNALKTVIDPELNVNIVDLGLIYDVVVEGNDVRVDMSLTSPGCPSGPEIMGDAQRQVETIQGIGTATINLVWSPPWTPDRIEPRVRAYLGF